MSRTDLGRHRAPGRLNHASNLSAAVSRAARPATKASAVLAVSGGMAASFALPASAAPGTPQVKTKAPATNAALAKQRDPAARLGEAVGGGEAVAHHQNGSFRRNRACRRDMQRIVVAT
jgi:hypothetical protein